MGNGTICIRLEDTKKAEFLSKVVSEKKDASEIIRGLIDVYLSKRDIPYEILMKEWDIAKAAKEEADKRFFILDSQKKVIEQKQQQEQIDALKALEEEQKIISDVATNTAKANLWRMV